MAKKLIRAVKAGAAFDKVTRAWTAYGLEFGACPEDCAAYIVPAAEYERLTKSAKRRGK